MKKCSACSEMKNESEFQVRKASKDGLTASCKACLKQRDSERYYGKEREARAERHRMYMATDDGKVAHAKAVARWQEQNKLRRAAHVIFSNAVKAGRIVPWPVCAMPDCDCKPEAHHPDYGQPIDVVWLCDSHHKQLHAEHRAYQRTQLEKEAA